MTPVPRFETCRTPAHFDVHAPDGSEIRLLPRVSGGSMAHCTLPVGGVTLAMHHQTVEELWYFLSGSGQVWRKDGSIETVEDVLPGIALSIPLGVHFQFRNTGDEPLRFVLVTMPPWPGEQEAVRVPDHWPI
ncbi:MAG: hypothetical protein OHK0046_42480 [Anaerolineae bacterium]